MGVKYFNPLQSGQNGARAVNINHPNTYVFENGRLFHGQVKSYHHVVSWSKIKPVPLRLPSDGFGASGRLVSCES